MRKVLYILGQLDDADVEWLVKAGRLEKHAKGAALIQKGTTTSFLYIVLDGRLQVVLPTGLTLAEVGVGEILGEISLVDSRPPSASVVVAEDCVVLAVPQRELRAELKRNQPFAARFYRALAIFLANRMRSTMTTLGYGDPRKAAPAISDEEDADVLDDEVLDAVYNAGLRFERMLKKLGQ
ncbi:MAG: cyclic nucleotide-binding domain-containing protein [Betaproteobacteria bacterium]